MAQITIDNRTPRDRHAMVGGVYLTLQELSELCPDVAIPKGYVRVDYMPGLRMHHLTKADGSQTLGAIPWPAGDHLLGRLDELQSQVAQLRAAKGHPEDGARRAEG